MSRFAAAAATAEQRPAAASASSQLQVVLERELADLPPLPLVAARLVRALGDTESAVSELARLIAMDQGIAAKVLRLVNSPYYGFSRQVTTISHAVVILGFNTVRNLVLAIAAFDKIPVGKDSPVEANAFWEHSIGVAACLQILARRKRLPVKVAEEAFLSGLLHDVGKLFLCQHFPDHYRGALEEAWAQKARISVTEQQRYGAPHTIVGKRIAERWNLPPALVTTVWRHHNLAQCPDHYDMVALVSASDALTRAAKIGFIGDPLPPSLTPDVAAWLGINAKMLAEVQEELRAKVADAREFLKMATGG